MTTYDSYYDDQYADGYGPIAIPIMVAPMTITTSRISTASCTMTAPG